MEICKWATHPTSPKQFYLKVFKICCQASNKYISKWNVIYWPNKILQKWNPFLVENSVQICYGYKDHSLLANMFITYGTLSKDNKAFPAKTLNAVQGKENIILKKWNTLFQRTTQNIRLGQQLSYMYMWRGYLKWCLFMAEAHKIINLIIKHVQMILNILLHKMTACQLAKVI